jgi:hypothetical protein
MTTLIEAELNALFESLKKSLKKNVTSSRAKTIHQWLREHNVESLPEKNSQIKACFRIYDFFTDFPELMTPGNKKLVENFCKNVDLHAPSHKRHISKP